MRVDRRDLHNALKELARLAPTRGPLPFLSNVLLSGVDGKLTLSSTDLTTRLTCELPAQGTPIEACVPAKLLATLVKPASKNAGEVLLELADDKLNVTINGSDLQLPTTDPQIFPAPFSTDKWDLVGEGQASVLRDALAWVLPATSSDPTRKHLNSVFIDRDAVVATDGHRLHLAPSPLTPEVPMLLPSRAAGVLSRILKQADRVVVARRQDKDQDQLRVCCGRWHLDARLLDEMFPPYHQVVPSKDALQSQVIFDTVGLSAVLAQVMKLADRGNIKVSVNGAVVLSPWGSALGEAELTVPTLENNHSGPDLELGLDGKYLLDTLPRSGQVELGLGGPLNPVRVDVTDRLAVIMPVRL